MDKTPVWLRFVKERMVILNIATASELSRRLGHKSHTTVSNWFVRKPDDPPRQLKKLAEVLDCTPEDIIVGKIITDSNNELSRLIKMMGRKEQFIVNSFIRLIAVDSNLLSTESLQQLKQHKSWYITIDKSQKKTITPVTGKTKKPKKIADINLQVFFT